MFGDVRLDAEAYTPEVIRVYEHLNALETVRLGDHAFITDGQHGYHIVDPDSPIRHLTAKCIQDWFVDDSEAERLALETHEKNLRSSCEDGDVLLSTAGTLGKAAIVTPDVLPANMDQDIARIHLETKVIDPWYLVAFLNSSVGRLQSDRVSTGQVQRHIALGKVREFSIPVSVDQASVVESVKRAFEERRQSATFYAEAEALLLAELGLDDLDLSHQPTYARDFSRAQAAGRLDAEYFQPRYDTLLARLRETGQAVRLGNWLTEPIRRGVQPEYNENGDVIVINSKHVGKTHVKVENNRRTTRAFAEQNERALVRRYDVLLNSTGYITIGRCQTLLSDVKAIADGHVSIIHPKSGLDPVYLGLFLNTLPGQMQTERSWTGSSGQIELRSELIENYTVWRPDVAFQRRIRELVEEAHVAREEAHRLLESAKRRVEEMVVGKEA